MGFNSGFKGLIILYLVPDVLNIYLGILLDCKLLSQSHRQYSLSNSMELLYEHQPRGTEPPQSGCQLPSNVGTKNSYT